MELSLDMIGKLTCMSDYWDQFYVANPACNAITLDV